jgi:hypothetical protein
MSSPFQIIEDFNIFQIIEDFNICMGLFLLMILQISKLSPFQTSDIFVSCVKFNTITIIIVVVLHRERLWHQATSNRACLLMA